MSFKQYLDECHARLRQKRRVAGACLLILVSVWSIEIAIAGALFSSIPALPWALSLTLCLATLVHIQRRFGPKGDPCLKITAMYLDRRHESGSLIETCLEASQASNTIQDPSRNALLARACQTLSQVRPRELISARPPRGFELGLAFALILALLIGSSQSSQGALFSGAMPQTSSLLQAEPESVFGGGANPDEKLEDGPLVEIVNPRPDPLSKPEDSKINGDKGDSMDRGQSPVERSKPGQDPESTPSLAKKAPETDRTPDLEKSDEKNAQSATKQDNAASQSARDGRDSSTEGSGAAKENTKESPTERKDFEGSGRGAVKKGQAAGTRRVGWVFDTKIQSRQKSQKMVLSWRMKSTLKKYFEQFNEEKR